MDAVSSYHCLCDCFVSSALSIDWMSEDHVDCKMYCSSCLTEVSFNNFGVLSIKIGEAGKLALKGATVCVFLGLYCLIIDSVIAVYVHICFFF